MAKVRRRPQVSDRRVGAIPCRSSPAAKPSRMVRSARSADAPASSMPRSRSPTYSSPFVIGRWRPIRRRRGTVQLWRERSLQFQKKHQPQHANSPLLDLPIRQVMGDAHYLPQSALPEVSGGGASNGWRNGRPNCCRFPISTSSSRCPRRSRPWPSRIRPSSMRSCSRPPSRP